ncbi:aminomethyl-transferring glycine dehydrogenase subunit GcvPA [Geothrix sp. PMB-07]|uniref:aminomethyl-transferring glycine dehydrogenase subunit GcvPA n=1 Tax=Geothrix sp. PMB-07 TaxID=3068640 RepID=UPI002740B556|nr:aminomethyl-transferring glycine dehydrogenase subunit GcvPA [Geothrix sp. PMB-07]WLT31617.1 aminomethyl-transferring glycine dehydrogenase subunit GcvPA [Geothrix sp. PMB-07]
MTVPARRAHPYIPNSEPGVKAAMLAAVGAASMDELYGDIPEALRFRGALNLPEAIPAEAQLKRTVERLLAKNTSCEEATSFLGAGCYNHYVPAICDEITRRAEFLTAYAGEPYEDFGRFQTLWEYESLMAELLDMDICNVPTFDWFQAAATSLRMAGRYTSRPVALVAGHISPDRLAAIRNYCEPVMRLELLAWDPKTGQLDLADLKAKLGDQVAAVYFENPGYLGCLETQGQAIADLAHGNGSLLVVGTDPNALGLLAPPSHFGADIVCGDIHTLGNHMHFGGGMGGFIATRDEEKLVMEYPSRLFGISTTDVPGEYGFGDVAYDRTSFAHREQGKEFVGTASALHGIAAAVYLSLMGPVGMKELGLHILQKAQYLAQELSKLPGVKAPAFEAPFYKELVVDFTATGRSVADINESLLKANIFGGKDLSAEFPALGQSALWAVTELVSQEEIDLTIATLRAFLGGN